ncbi:glycine--tRNA ligase subunit beta [Sphingomonas sp.]|uniref:glycine--tRNA ligase subunit beta n=1 Tax=Sphingomonas sp. TaxID=28214 RepID=UPI001B002B29|nr:glycine--tRNA ligase subunit beta [Sphingomonas sp.]MBO9711337.1 glycine--tRNA ligase subunit beta [Sphingomonas sp.]
MTDFLLELRSEEIPARMQASARAALKLLFGKALAEAGIFGIETQEYATPRRLALIARGLPEATAAVAEEVKGPRTSAPEQALEGFLRKTGLAREQLVERDGVWFAVIDRPGRATTAVLAEIIPPLIRAFPWPKSMRWGEASLSTESLRWVRPLQGIVALFGSEVVPCEIAGVTSGRTTAGHRFLHRGLVTIESVETYVDALLDAHVRVVDDERRALIREGAAALAAEAGLVLVEDEGLVAENAGLTEWPVPLLGRFDADFLSVPPEVIQLTARVNQKYFVCRDREGKLANAFICVANIAADDDGAKIIEGNRKVLAARLSDARFFYETDRKVPLEEQAKKLEKIVFHEKLGTVADKVERVAKLARWLVEEDIIKPLPFRGGVGVGPVGLTETGVLADSPHPNPSPEGEGLGKAALADLAERAARLAKADLVTGMVGEFPELQGLMGGYYAAAQGEDAAVAEAIRDHYKPVGQGDDVPTAPVTVAVSLADKLDTIVSFFGAGMEPTGSRDPFALRRAALGIIGLIFDNRLRFSLSSAMQAAGTPHIEGRLHHLMSLLPMSMDDIYERRAEAGGSRKSPIFLADETTKTVEIELLTNRVTVIGEAAELYWQLHGFGFARGQNAFASKLLDFFADRLKVQQREAGVRHDLIDAVFALGGEDDLVRLLARVHALQAFVGTEDGANLLAGYKRAANILKKESFDGTDVGVGADIYEAEPAESALIEALNDAEPKAEAAVDAEDFEGAMAALAGLRGPIDAFFDQVTVNDSDSAKRTARLALLARMRDAVHKVADFSRIEG